MIWSGVVFKVSEFYAANFLSCTVGVDSTWSLYKNLSVIGNLSTAFMLGNWKVNDVYSRPEALFGVVTPTTITTSMNQLLLGTMMIDYFMGFEWQHQGTFDVVLQL